MRGFLSGYHEGFPFQISVKETVSIGLKRKYLQGTVSLDPLRFMRGFLPDISKGSSFTKGFLSGY
jgi:hypothetical protein